MRIYRDEIEKKVSDEANRKIRNLEEDMEERFNKINFGGHGSPFSLLYALQDDVHKIGIDLDSNTTRLDAILGVQTKHKSLLSETKKDDLRQLNEMVIERPQIKQRIHTIQEKVKIVEDRVNFHET